jgi:hypothetical protein
MSRKLNKTEKTASDLIAVSFDMTTKTTTTITTKTTMMIGGVF